MNSDELPTKPVRTPFIQRVSDFRRGPMIMLIWIIAATAAGWMLSRRSSQFEYMGIARPIQYEVSVTTAGRIETLFVDRFDSIEAGDVVARLDSAGIEASIATTRARIDQLAAEVQGALFRLRARAEGEAVDQFAELRRFQLDEAQLLLSSLETKTTLETDRIRLQRILLRLEREADLATDGVTPLADVDDLRLESNEVARRIEMNEQLLSQTKEEHVAATSRREMFEKRISYSYEFEPLLHALQEAMRVEGLKLDEIELARRHLILRAPASGKISEVLARSGQALMPGEPIVSITAEQPGGVICYLPSSSMYTPDVGARVLVSRQGGSQPAAESSITRIGPEVEEIPQCLWRDPTIPEYGLPILLASIPDITLIPGEPVRIHMVD